MLINKFTAGMMIGGIAGVMGIKMMNSSKRERKNDENGRKFIERAGEFIEELR